MLPVAKAHAYGNDFLFVPMEQVEGLRLDELSRRLCDRHSGLGGDGVIYYTIAPDGTARMKLINTDGSPSELSGNGLRCLAALVLHQREAAELPAVPEVRVDTDAGWKTLTLIGRQGSRYTFRAAMGQPERVREETIEAAGETLTVTTLAIGNPQCVALVKELPDPRALPSSRPGAVHAPAISRRHQRRIRGRRSAGSRAHPDLGARRRSDARLRHRRVRVGDRRDRAWRRRARHRGHRAGRHAARRVAGRWNFPDRVGRGRVRRSMGAADRGRDADLVRDDPQDRSVSDHCAQRERWRNSRSAAARPSACGGTIRGDATASISVKAA